MDTAPQRATRYSADAVLLLSLDVWGTLILPNPRFDQRRLELLYDVLECAPRGIGSAALAASFKLSKGETEAESERSGLHIGLEARIADLCARLGIPAPSNDEIQRLRTGQSRLLRQDPPLLLDPGIPTFLADVSASGRQVAVVSNLGLVCADDVRFALEAAGLLPLLDHQFFSDEMGVAKPNPDVFTRVTHHSGVCAPAVLHVGDSERCDFLGPTDVGMHASLGPLSSAHLDSLSATLRLPLRSPTCR